MKAYLVTTGTIWALFGATHVFVTFEHWRQPVHETGSLFLPALFAAAGAGLAVWAFQLVRRASPAAG
jgi:hypothetical protein